MTEVLNQMTLFLIQPFPSRLVNDIQELALKAGYTATYCKSPGHTYYCLYFSIVHQELKTDFKNQKLNVYCVEVPNHLFYSTQRKSGVDRQFGLQS